MSQVLFLTLIIRLKPGCPLSGLPFPSSSGAYSSFRFPSYSPLFDRRSVRYGPRSLCTSFVRLSVDMYSGYRYIVFASFVVCNAIVVTSAVWNLSLVQHTSTIGATADKYSIFVGGSSLLFIFPVLFLEIANKDIFVTKVWFELVWVASFCVLGLVGAALATVAGVDSLCRRSSSSGPESVKCISNRVLQGSSWMGSLMLLSYFVLLAIFSLLKNKEDGTIWSCYTRRFPWNFSQTQLPNSPLSPTRPGHQRQTSKISIKSLRRMISRSSRAPTIAAPKPRHAVNTQAIQDGILSYRSGLSLEYEIEHFQPGTRPIVRPEPVFAIEEKHQRPTVVSPHVASPIPAEHSLYPEHMRAALGSMGVREPPNALGPSAQVPSPAGNWPLLNPPARHLGNRRKGSGDPSASHPLMPPTLRSRPAGPRRPSASYAPRPGQAPESAQVPTYGART